MKKRLCAVILIFLLLNLFSGCDQTQTTEEVKDVRISNLKTPEMIESAEEKAFMDGVCDVLRTAVCYRGVISSHTICATNVSDYELDLDLYVAVYNSDGELVEHGWRYVQKWEKGQMLSIDYGVTNTDMDRITVMAEYNRDGTVYMTDPIPMQLSDDIWNSNISLRYERDLPCAVSLMADTKAPASYTLLEYQLEHSYDNTYILYLVMRKESGKDNYGDNYQIRIVDEDGVVHSTDSCSYIYTKQGETVKTQVYVTLTEGREYTIQLR